MDKNTAQLSIKLFTAIIKMFVNGVAEFHISNGNASFNIDLKKLAAYTK